MDSGTALLSAVVAVEAIYRGQRAARGDPENCAAATDAGRAGRLKFLWSRTERHPNSLPTSSTLEKGRPWRAIAAFKNNTRQTLQVSGRMSVIALAIQLRCTETAACFPI